MIVLYKVLFNKPISVKKVFEHDIGKEKNLQGASEDIVLLSKRSVEKKELEKYWERFEVAEPAGLSKLLYHKTVVSALRRVMRQKAGLTFSEEEVLDALHNLITKPIESVRPSKPIEPRAKKSNTGNVESVAQGQAERGAMTNSESL